MSHVKAHVTRFRVSEKQAKSQLEEIFNGSSTSTRQQLSEVPNELDGERGTKQTNPGTDK